MRLGLWGPRYFHSEAEATIADPRLWHPTKSFDGIVERAIVPNIERLYRMLRSPTDAGQFLSFSAKEPSQQRKPQSELAHLDPHNRRVLRI